MGQPFPEEVTSGTVLIIPAIQSPNFSISGETGWSIMQNGDAYFYNLTASGEVIATTIISQGSANTGVFVYDGTAELGNPPIAWMTSGTEDPYGNTVATGVGGTVGSINGSTLTASSVPSTAVDFTARSIGGITTTVASSAPSGAKNGDLWIDTSAGNALYQYNGSWALYQFGSGSVAANSISAAQIAANTITATQIAAGTITAAQIQAGIVLAGVVNGTLIEGAQFVAYGTTGEILVYSGTPAAGNLVASVSGMSSTDGYGNTYPQGVAAFSAFPSGDQFQVTLQDSSAGTGEAHLTFQNVTDPWATEPNVNALGDGSSTGAVIGISSGESTGSAQPANVACYDSVFADFVFTNLSGSAVVLGGANVVSSPIYAYNGTAAKADVWQYVGTGSAPNFGSGWSNRGSPWAPMAYRLLASPPNSVQVEGWVSSASTDPQLITLPSQYVPAHRQTIVGYDGSANAAVQWNIDETGLITLATATAVNGDNYFISGIYSLDL